MKDKNEKETKTVSVPPEREPLVLSCYEKLGYQTESVVRDEHGDTKITLCLQDADAFDPARAARVDAIFAELFAIDRQVMLSRQIQMLSHCSTAAEGSNTQAKFFNVSFQNTG